MVHCVCVCVCARVCLRAGGVSAGRGQAVRQCVCVCARACVCPQAGVVSAGRGQATPSFQGSGGLGEGNTPISTWDTTSPCVSAPQRGRFLKQTQGPHRI